MFQDHPHLSLPDAAAPLWRYVDLWKFVSLLEHASLWFSRLDTLEDPYEGLPTKPLMDDVWSIIEAGIESERASRAQLASHSARVFQSGRETLAVSCWHVNPVESLAMWRLYAPAGEGIAIRTTFENFRRSFSGTEQIVYGGLVQYVDFESYRVESFNVLHWATLKRLSFAHEREFRAMVMSSDWPPPKGIPVRVDVNTLITYVYVSPQRLLGTLMLLSAYVHGTAQGRSFPITPSGAPGLHAPPYRPRKRCLAQLRMILDEQGSADSRISESLRLSSCHDPRFWVLIAVAAGSQKWTSPC